MNCLHSESTQSELFETDCLPLGNLRYHLEIETDYHNY